MQISNKDLRNYTTSFLVFSIPTIITCFIVALACFIFPYDKEVLVEREVTTAKSNVIHVASSDFRPHFSIVQEEVSEPIISVTEKITTIAEPQTETASVPIQPAIETPLEEYVIQVATQYGIRPEMVKALIQVESNWRPDVSNGPHIGLMQINCNIHAGRMQKLGVTDLYDPYSNILVGVDLLSELYVKYGDEGAALTAYNTGSFSGAYNHYAYKVLELANNY